MKKLIFTAVFTVLSCLTLISCAKYEYNAEAGQILTAYAVTGNPLSSFGEDFNPDCVNHAGKYTFSVLTDGKSEKVKLTVTDTSAPSATLKKAYAGAGTDLPDASCFIEKITEADDYTVGYIQKPSSYTYGDNAFKIQITDASGNKSPVYDAVLCIIDDRQAPEIHGAGDLSVYAGQGVAYKSGVTVSDNCAGVCKLEVDSSGVDIDKPGDYTAKYTATDASGNKTEVTVGVHVYEKSVSLDELNKKLDELLPTFITPGMSREEQCRAIYKYIRNNIAYLGNSEKRDWVSSAYDALFGSKGGDCYSYFSSAKAMLERLGIENLDVKRTEGYGTGTHYWCMVNIGTANSPRWYHFDCTRLTSDYNVSGCLLTDAQVAAYDEWRAGSYFRHYDKSRYPQSESEIITQIPELKGYIE